SWGLGLLSSFLSGFRSSCCTSSLSRTSSASSSSFLSWLSIFKHQLIEIYQFDDTHLGIVTQTITGLNDPGISTWSVTHFFCYLSKKHFDSLFALYHRESHPSIVGSIFFSSRNDRFYMFFQLLSLGKRCRNTLVKNQGSTHI